MKQIPNIEETHNTREVEELKKEFIAEYKAGHKEGGMRSYLFTGQNGSLIADWWIEKLHHQLQKARQDWLQEEIVRLEGMKTGAELRSGDYSEHRGIGFDKALQTIIDRYHSELDQDTETLDK